MQTNISPLVIQGSPQPEICSYPSATDSCLLPSKCWLPHSCSGGMGRVVSIPAAILGVTGTVVAYKIQTAGLSHWAWMFNNLPITSIGCYHQLKLYVEKSGPCSVLFWRTVLYMLLVRGGFQALSIMWVSCVPFDTAYALSLDRDFRVSSSDLP